MTLPESEKQRRRVRREDEKALTPYRKRIVRKQAKEIRYVFYSTVSPKVMKGVEVQDFKLWDVIHTPKGPHLVREIFWRSNYHADVILKPVTVKKTTQKKRQFHNKRDKQNHRNRQKSRKPRGV